MPIQKRNKRAANPSQFSELSGLLNLFPCPAWIEDFSGKILACNTRHRARAVKNWRSLKPRETFAYALPPAGKTKLRLVALFPAGWKAKADCQRRVISALLAKTLRTYQAPQTAATQAVVANENHLTPCQREIYRELSQGHSFKTIATHLGITHEAVRQRVVRIRRKLGVSKIPLRRQQARKQCPSLKVT